MIIVVYQEKKGPAVQSAFVAAWVGTIRRKSTREENAELSAYKNEGTYRSGEGGEGPAV